MVTFQTSDKAADVAEKYSKKLKAKDWAQKTTMDMEGQHIRMFEKDNRIVNIMAAPDDDGTTIRVTVSEK
jgi:hypothetical protein